MFLAIKNYRVTKTNLKFNNFHVTIVINEWKTKEITNDHNSIVI